MEFYTERRQLRRAGWATRIEGIPWASLLRGEVGGTIHYSPAGFQTESVWREVFLFGKESTRSSERNIQ